MTHYAQITAVQLRLQLSFRNRKRRSNRQPRLCLPEFPECKTYPGESSLILDAVGLEEELGTHECMRHGEGRLGSPDRHGKGSCQVARLARVCL